MKIGYRIKSKREMLGISQTDLANKVGIAKQTLYKYENNIVTNIPSDVIEKLSYYLECSPAYLMGWEEIPTLDARYSFDTASLVSKVRNDSELIDALQIYFSLPADKKKYVTSLIKMLGH